VRLLLTSPYAVWPADSGPAARTLGIARALAEMGHDVTVLAARGPSTTAPAGAVALRGYAAHGRLGHFFNVDFRRTWRRELAERRPDLVVSSYPYQAFMLAGPAARADVPVVYDAQNVEAHRFRSLGRPLGAQAVRAAEAFLCARARAVLAVSVEDQELLERYYGCPSLLLPNGVDVTRFQPGAPERRLIEAYGLENRRVALFFGWLDYPPNRDALRYLVREAWPSVRARLLGAVLLVVGRHPPDWARGAEGVVVTGAVEDIAAHIRLAHVVAVPLDAGGGMRLKVVEALACGQTVLSTRFGATGLPADGEGLILAERDEFAARLAQLLRDTSTPGANAAARRLATGFEWRRLVARVDWNDLAGPRRRLEATTPSTA
jgi:glycosyltransferase involved in cell wall biosynthesis